jgi:hypothetical protein
MADQESPNKGISDGLEELSGVIAAADSNLAKNCKLLNAKIKALERKVASTLVPMPMLVALTMDTHVHDAHGDCVTTLGRLMQESDDIKHENSLLLQRLDQLAADITAQGGVMLGRHTFTSEIHLLQLCLKEFTKGDAFAALLIQWWCSVLTSFILPSLDGRHSPRQWRSQAVTRSRIGRWLHPAMHITLIGFWNTRWWLRERRWQHLP